MLTFSYHKLASNLVMLIARHLLFYGLYNPLAGVWGAPIRQRGSWAKPPEADAFL
jgi:hypothetical protein